MYIDIIWDLPEDPTGNVQHIAEHDVSREEVEEVFHDPNSTQERSRSSDNEITFGHTSTGRHLAVVWQRIDDDPLTVYPVTAYDVPERRRRP